jgi:predicted acylesterase/phospholipase RssA
VGVAIAASAALPGVLPPLVLHLPGHRPADCPGASGCPPSPEEDQDLVDLPLADGGIVDNLGLEVLLRGGVPPGTRAVVVIVVNARRLHVPPGIVASSALLTAGYSAVIQQRRIDDLLLALARERLRLLEAQGRILGRHLRTELQVISFDQSTRSEELDVIGTRLHLQEEEVDRLVQEGHAVMRSRLPELLPFWEEAGRTPPPR